MSAMNPSDEAYAQDERYEGDDEESCPDCLGDGVYHDCGEDTCCCADPESQDLVICRTCGGAG